MSTFTKTLAFSVASALLMLVSMPTVHAQVAGNPLNYGGRITFSYFCTCSENWAVVISPPKPMTLGYNYTPQFANYMIPHGVGSAALGTYVPPAAPTCWDIAPPPVYCEPSLVVQPLGLFTPLVGTSLR